MATLAVRSGEQAVRFLVADNPFLAGGQLQSPAQPHGDIGQVDQGHGIVSVSNVGIRFAAGADGVEKIKLVIFDQLGRLLRRGLSIRWLRSS